MSRRVTQSSDEEEATDVWERLSETRRTDTTQVCVAPSTLESAKSLSHLVLPRCCLSVTLLSHSYFSLIVGLSLLSILESVRSQGLLQLWYCLSVTLLSDVVIFFTKDKIILENRINFWFTFIQFSKIISSLFCVFFLTKPQVWKLEILLCSVPNNIYVSFLSAKTKLLCSFHQKLSIVQNQLLFIFHFTSLALCFCSYALNWLFFLLVSRWNLLNITQLHCFNF